MKTGYWAAIMLLCLSAPAQAADWWLLGTETNPAALAYVDRSLIQPAEEGKMEAWLLEVFDKPLPTGATRQVTVYRLDCRNRHYERVGGAARDEEGRQLEVSSSAPPTGTIPRDTVAYAFYSLVCGRPTGREVRVDDPYVHAGGYFHRVYAADQVAQAPRENAPPQESAPPGENAPGPGTPAEQAEGVGTSVGTGFFVGPEGYALTSWHVVEGARRIACRTGDGVDHEAALTRMSPANDLALLRVDFRPVHFLGFAPRGSLRPGERVFTIGYGAPNYLGTNEPRFTEGTISALSGLDADDAYVQITVPIQPGNSGGPLVNEAGQVVGIIAASAATEAFERVEGAEPQSINWAVKADYATPLLPPQPPAAPRARAQAIALVHDAVCLVIAVHGGE